MQISKVFIRIIIIAEMEARMRQADTACIMDMGTYLLPKVAGKRLVMQLVVPGLEERARAFPDLGGCHHSPGTGMHCTALWCMAMWCMALYCTRRKVGHCGTAVRAHACQCEAITLLMQTGPISLVVLRSAVW